MSVISNTGAPTQPGALHGLSESPYVRLRKVLYLRRAHPRGDFPQTYEPESLQDCLVVPSDAIGQYHLKVVGPWASYKEGRQVQPGDRHAWALSVV
jgi:hypothetical protein